MTQDMTIGVQGGSLVANERDWDKLIDTFLTFQQSKQSSKNLYKRTLRQFFRWIDRKGYSTQVLSFPFIVEYREELLHEGKSPLTVGSYLTSIRIFFEWLESMKIYPNIAKGVKTPRGVYDFKHQHLLPEQVKSLLSYFEERGNLRDLTMVTLMVRTGLRTIEVVRANVGDIDIEMGQPVLHLQRKGKDTKEGFVKLPPKTYQSLLSYIRSMGKVKDSDPLFPSQSYHQRTEQAHLAEVGFTPDRMTTRSVSRIVKTGLKAIGLEGRKYTAHSLRHTAGVAVLRAGGDVFMVQEILGHSTPTTSEIYTRSYDREKRLTSVAGEDLIERMY